MSTPSQPQTAYQIRLTEDKVTVGREDRVHDAGVVTNEWRPLNGANYNDTQCREPSSEGGNQSQKRSMASVSRGAAKKRYRPRASLPALCIASLSALATTCYIPHAPLHHLHSLHSTSRSMHSSG